MANLAWKLLGWRFGLEVSYPYIDGLSLFFVILTAPKAPYPETNRVAWCLVGMLGLHFFFSLFPLAVMDLGLWSDQLGFWAVFAYDVLYRGLFLAAVLSLWGNTNVRAAVGAFLEGARGIFRSPARYLALGASSLCAKKAEP